MTHKDSRSYSFLQQALQLMPLLCFLLVSGCSSPSPRSCSSQPVSLQWHWVCDSINQAVTQISSDDGLTYHGRPVCLDQSAVLTSQSFESITDDSHDGVLSVTVSLTPKAAKAFRQTTGSNIGRVLATVLIQPVASEDLGHSTGSTCDDQTIVLNLSIVHSALGGELTLTGWQSHQQIQRVIDSTK